MIALSIFRPVKSHVCAVFAISFEASPPLFVKCNLHSSFAAMFLYLVVSVCPKYSIFCQIKSIHYHLNGERDRKEEKEKEKDRERERKKEKRDEKEDKQWWILSREERWEEKRNACSVTGNLSAVPDDEHPDETVVMREQMWRYNALSRFAPVCALPRT